MTDAFKKVRDNMLISKGHYQNLDLVPMYLWVSLMILITLNEIKAEQGNAKQTEAEEKNIKLREELEEKVNVFFNKMKEAQNTTTLNASGQQHTKTKLFERVTRQKLTASLL